jgi:hypothetical protein
MVVRAERIGGNVTTRAVLTLFLLPRNSLMADENSKNPNVKQPGENPEGKFHYNPGNMAGEIPGDEKQTSENRDEVPEKTKVKPGA